MAPAGALTTMAAASLVTLACLAATAATNAVSRWAAVRWRSPLTPPVFLSSALVAAALLAGGLDDRDYAPARAALTLLLGPATVALALPLHRNLHALRGRCRAGAPLRLPNRPTCRRSWPARGSPT